MATPTICPWDDVQSHDRLVSGKFHPSIAYTMTLWFTSAQNYFYQSQFCILIDCTTPVLVLCACTCLAKIFARRRKLSYLESRVSGTLKIRDFMQLARLSAFPKERRR